MVMIVAASCCGGWWRPEPQRFPGHGARRSACRYPGPRGSCLGLRRIQMAACLSNVLQHSVEIRMVFPDPCEWYPRMGDSHLRNLQTHHFPFGQALLSQHPQPLDRLVTRLAFCDQRDRLCRFSAIGLLIKSFDKDSHLHDTFSLSAKCWARGASTHPTVAWR